MQTPELDQDGAWALSAVVVVFALTGLVLAVALSGISGDLGNDRTR